MTPLESTASASAGRADQVPGTPSSLPGPERELLLSATSAPEQFNVVSMQAALDVIAENEGRVFKAIKSDLAVTPRVRALMRRVLTESAMPGAIESWEIALQESPTLEGYRDIPGAPVYDVKEVWVEEDCLVAVAEVDASASSTWQGPTWQGYFLLANEQDDAGDVSLRIESVFMDALNEGWDSCDDLN